MIYHISADGKPRPCHATKACPIGGVHFQTKLAAIAYLEAKELKSNGGSFGYQLGRDQRYRLARSKVLPVMNYAQQIGDNVYDQYGNAWAVQNRTETDDTAKPVFQLQREKDGKIVTLDPKNEVHKFDTAFEKDIDTGKYSISTVINYLSRKQTGNWTIRDFYQTVPEPINLDKPPIRISPQYFTVPEGVTIIHNAAVRHINVHTSVDKPVSSRWLVVEKENTKELSHKQRRELMKAAFEQTGRPLSEFAKLSDYQKSEYSNFEWRGLRISNSGENVVLEHYSPTDESFKLTGEEIKPEDICGYKLTQDLAPYETAQLVG